jgi:hypothetical protein
MDNSDLIWAWVNYDNTIEESAGLVVTPEGQLIEQLGVTRALVDGIYVVVIPGHGGTGDLIVDYIHEYLKKQ